MTSTKNHGGQQSTTQKNYKSTISETNKLKQHLHVVHKNVVGGSSMIGFPFVIAVSEWDMPGIKPGPLGWHVSALTNELEEVRQ